MNKNPKYLLLLALLSSFAFQSMVHAALKTESKVIPLKESNYRKEEVGPKKAVKKAEPTKTSPATVNKANTVNTATAAKDSESAKPTSKVVTNGKAINVPAQDTKPAARAAVDTSSKSSFVASNKPSVSVPIKPDATLATIAEKLAELKKQQTSSKTTKSTDTKTTTKPSSAKTSTSKTTNTNTTTTKAPTTKTTTSSKKVEQPKKETLKTEKTSKKERIKEPDLRVKLGTGTYEKITVVFPNGGQILNSKGKRVKALKANEEFTWTSKIEAKEEKAQKGKKNTKKVQKPKTPPYINETLTFNPNKSLFKFNGNEYRGHLTLKFTTSGATAVNILGIEDYLRGVVGSEIGASSPEESLKAQTVIARTYAYANKGRHGSDNADVCNTTHCQVYSGVKAERASVDAAVKATKGFVLTYNGNPISALYFATCGGMTSNNSAVFGGNQLPYLVRVPCNFCTNGSKYRWNQEISVPELRSALAKENVKLEEVYGVKIDAPANSVMDRVSYMVFQTKNGEQKIKGTTIRRIFNLPSTTFVLGNRQEATDVISSAKSVPTEPVKPIKYKNNPNILISCFSDIESSPKQLLVYCADGLIRTKMPSDGWRFISYNFSKSGSASSSGAKSANTKGLSSTTSPKYASKKEKNLKPITKINLFGRGYGHQVGLCQSGAVEMGKKGWNYKQILAHYYHEVALKSLGY